MASSSERLHIDMYQLIDDYMEQRKFSRAATAAFTGHRFVDASQRVLHRGNTSRSGFQMLCLMLMGRASEISYPALPLDLT